MKMARDSLAFFDIPGARSRHFRAVMLPFDASSGCSTQPLDPAMYDPPPDVKSELTRVAETALRASGMDSVGLYRFTPERRFEYGVIIGMPEAFTRRYEITGMRIDPVLRRMRETEWPCSTETLLGDRWTSCQLYNRVSGHFGLHGFAALPLFREEELAGILYLGALTAENARRLTTEGICRMSPYATRTSTALLRMRRRHPRLTPRQDDVARLAADGLSNRDIAEELSTGEAAVRKHLKALNQLFGTRNRTAMAAAWRNGSRPD